MSPPPTEDTLGLYYATHRKEKWRAKVLAYINSLGQLRVAKVTLGNRLGTRRYLANDFYKWEVISIQRNETRE